MDEELYHHGVKGQKWGVRRTPAQLGHTTGTKKKKSGPSVLSKAKTAISNRREASKQKKAEASAKKSRKKKISEMSDEELRERISRLELEKRYRDLTPKQTHRGRDFVIGVLESSGRNIATQTTTYLMGQAMNKALRGIAKDPQAINPKKGQKDK